MVAAWLVPCEIPCGGGWKSGQKFAPMQDRTTDLQFTRLTLYH
jgi:hypothetical protein